MPLRSGALASPDTLALGGNCVFSICFQVRFSSRNSRPCGRSAALTSTFSVITTGLAGRDALAITTRTMSAMRTAPTSSTATLMMLDMGRPSYRAEMKRSKAGSTMTSPPPLASATPYDTPRVAENIASARSGTKR